MNCWSMKFIDKSRKWRYLCTKCENGLYGSTNLEFMVMEKSGSLREPHQTKLKLVDNKLTKTMKLMKTKRLKHEKCVKVWSWKLDLYGSTKLSWIMRNVWNWILLNLEKMEVRCMHWMFRGKVLQAWIILKALNVAARLAADRIWTYNSTMRK